MSARITARFDDGKDEGALRTIGEVSSALGIKTHVLRYWEQQFPALAPLKRSGRRYYRSEDIALLETIDRLVNREGYTLKGAQQAIKGGRAGGLEQAAVHVAAELAPELVYSESGLVGDDPMPGNLPGPDYGKSAATFTPATSVTGPDDIIARLKSIRASLAAAIA